MKIVLALVLIAAAVFRVTESVNTCATLDDKPENADGTAGSDCTKQCFASVTIAITGGDKSFVKGCKECTPGDPVITLNAAKDKWVKTMCCNGDNSTSPPGKPDCNSILDVTKPTADIGPKCMECESKDEKCVKGGTAAAAPYKEGTVVCNVETSSCSVEMKDGKVKRGCVVGCKNVGKAGDAISMKCCKNAHFCNNHDPTKESTDGGDGDKDGAQAVFASYALLFSCLLLAYLK